MVMNMKRLIQTLSLGGVRIARIVRRHDPEPGIYAHLGHKQARWSASSARSGQPGGAPRGVSPRAHNRGRGTSKLGTCWGRWERVVCAVPDVYAVYKMCEFSALNDEGKMPKG